jgi:hypothetical protein
MVLDQNIFFFYQPFFYALLDPHFSRFGRFSLILKWYNLYFHHSEDLLADNIVSNVSCKFIQAIVVQASIIFYNILATLRKLYHMHSLAHSLTPFSLHLYMSIHWTMHWTIR